MAKRIGNYLRSLQKGIKAPKEHAGLGNAVRLSPLLQVVDSQVYIFKQHGKFGQFDFSSGLLQVLVNCANMFVQFSNGTVR